jgi:hypothetical protein
LEAKTRGSLLGLLIQLGANTRERLVISMLVIYRGGGENREVSGEGSQEEKKGNSHVRSGRAL